MTAPLFASFILALIFSGTSLAAPKGTSKSTAKNVSEQPVDYRHFAEQELQLPETQKTSQILPTPATVRTSVEPIFSPVRYTALQFGVSYQQYQPQGRAIANGRAQDLQPQKTPGLVAVDLRWLPLEFEAAPFVYLGGFFSLGYSRSELSVRDLTGSTYKNTYAHSLKTQFGLASEFHLPRNPRWSLATLLGAGRLDLVQASDSTFASGTEKLYFGSAGLLGQFRVWRGWTFYGGYEYRQAFESKEPRIGIQRDNFLIGFLGSVN